MIVTTTKTVQVIDNKATGKNARGMRTKAGVPMSVFARHIRLRTGHINNLERGVANWTPELADRYMRALSRIRRVMEKC